MGLRAGVTSSGKYRGSLLAGGRSSLLGNWGMLWMDLTPKGYKQVSRTWLFAATRVVGSFRCQPGSAVMLSRHSGHVATLQIRGCSATTLRA